MTALANSAGDDPRRARPALAQARVDTMTALRDAGITAAIAFGSVPAADRFSDHGQRRERADPDDPLAALVRRGRRRRRRPLRLCAIPRTAAAPARHAAGRDDTAGVAQFRRPMVRSFRHRFCRRLSGAGARHRRLFPKREMDRQFRHPDSDLCDAGLGIEHRGRARRSARPRLCGVLRGRRLLLCAARQDTRPVVLGSAAGLRHPRLVLGRFARFPGVAAARRLSRHRDARLRRDHSHGDHQFHRTDQRLCRHRRHSAAVVFRHSVQCRRQRLCRRVRTAVQPGLSRHLSLLRHPGAGAC